mmetsp:Transcript_4550/g.9412  ORF Transcript_4550/g.9412 Transcript_4550/m.9412 type:complete len:206 (+) Transcript_4550:140-757(+)
MSHPETVYFLKRFQGSPPPSPERASNCGGLATESKLVEQPSRSSWNVNEGGESSPKYHLLDGGRKHIGSNHGDIGWGLGSLSHTHQQLLASKGSGLPNTSAGSQKAQLLYENYWKKSTEPKKYSPHRMHDVHIWNGSVKRLSGYPSGSILNNSYATSGDTRRLVGFSQRVSKVSESVASGGSSCPPRLPVRFPPQRDFRFKGHPS